MQLAMDGGKAIRRPRRRATRPVGGPKKPPGFSHLDTPEEKEIVPPHRTTLFIEWKLYKRLKQRSEDTGQSLTRQVNHALRLYLDAVESGREI